MDPMSSNLKRKKLFYAEYEADMYDSTIELVAPQYQLAHETLMQLLIYHFCGKTEVAPVRSPGDHFCGWEATTDEPRWLLDVGSGTGVESISAMLKFPQMQVVAIDVVQEMHEKFRSNFNKVFQNQRFESRVIPVTADIMAFTADHPEHRELLHLLPVEERPRKFDAIISAFAIHNSLEDAEKQEVYRCLYDALQPGGIFINADLYNYQSDTLSGWAHQYDMDWIERQFTQPDEKFAELARRTDKGKLDGLKNRWKDHYLTVNRLGPIESAGDALRPQDELRALDSQAQMLIQAGFAEVGTPFRFWQMGILWGKKSERDLANN